MKCCRTSSWNSLSNTVTLNYFYYSSVFMISVMFLTRMFNWFYYFVVNSFLHSFKVFKTQSYSVKVKPLSLSPNPQIVCLFAFKPKQKTSSQQAKFVFGSKKKDLRKISSVSNKQQQEPTNEPL